MTEELGKLPDAKVDNVDRAPGGADATPLESDTGAGESSHEGSQPLTPDQPLSAQQEEEKIPDAIQEPENEEPDEQSTDNTDAEQAPSG